MKRKDAQKEPKDKVSNGLVDQVATSYASKVQTLLWSLEFLIQMNHQQDTMAVSINSRLKTI